MNKIKLFISFFAILFIATSCDREPELPVVLFEDAEKGAYPRLLDFNGTFYLTDVENSALSWEVEFYDEDNGSHVTEYVWTVAYRDNTGNNSQPETLIATIPSSEFTTAASGLPSTSRSWTFQQVLDVFGFTAADINGGDAFNFFATLKRDDGKEFTTVTTGDNIEGSSTFAGFFRFTMNVICTSELEGVFDVTTVGWCGETFTGQREWVNEGDGAYSMPDGDFQFGAYDVCYGPGPTYPCDPGTCALRIQDSCNRISITGTDRWGYGFTISALSVSGDELTFDWANGYAPEAGTTTLKRTDGKDWPPLQF